MTNNRITPILTQPLARHHMPTDTNISLQTYMGRSAFGDSFSEAEPRIPLDYGPAQSMSGFEKTYRNIVDYIVRITYRIWEDRDVEYIAETYAKDSYVFDDYGLQRGNRKIIEDTYHTTGAFSDIKLIADEVVWSGDDEVGYHTSHRVRIRGTNDRPSKYGPATGRQVDVFVIANCVAKNNEIYLEHVLYNNSSLLSQLGFDVNKTAREMAVDAPAGWPRNTETWEQLRRAGRPEKPISVAEPISGFDPDGFLREAFTAVWNDRAFDRMPEFFDGNVRFEGPTDRLFHGTKAYQEFLIDLFQTFPGLLPQIDEIYWMGNEEEGYLASLRWSGEAQHRGEGLYGSPTLTDSQFWGISQFHIVKGKIISEWMLFNELDVMMQIEAARS